MLFPGKATSFRLNEESATQELNFLHDLRSCRKTSLQLTARGLSFTYLKPQSPKSSYSRYISQKPIYWNDFEKTNTSDNRFRGRDAQPPGL